MPLLAATLMHFATLLTPYAAVALVMLYALRHSLLRLHIYAYALTLLSLFPPYAADAAAARRYGAPLFSRYALIPCHDDVAFRHYAIRHAMPPCHAYALRRLLLTAPIFHSSYAMMVTIDLLLPLLMIFAGCHILLMFEMLRQLLFRCHAAAITPCRLFSPSRAITMH